MRDGSACFWITSSHPVKRIADLPSIRSFRYARFCLYSQKRKTLTREVMADAATCSHCGKQGKGFKRCSVCKDVSYCGAECQKVAWKKHKKTCSKPIPLAAALHTDFLQEVFDGVRAADQASDWRRVLTYEDRMEEMLADEPDGSQQLTLSVFLKAHQTGLVAATPLPSMFTQSIASGSKSSASWSSTRCSVSGTRESPCAARLKTSSGWGRRRRPRRCSRGHVTSVPRTGSSR